MNTRGSGLTGLEKIGYKPIGMVLGFVGGMVAGKVFGLVWKRLSGEEETPPPLSEEAGTLKVLAAATLQGAIFALVKTAVDRYGLKSVRRLLGSPPPSRPYLVRDHRSNGHRDTAASRVHAAAAVRPH